MITNPSQAKVQMQRRPEQLDMLREDRIGFSNCPCVVPFMLLHRSQESHRETKLVARPIRFSQAILTMQRVRYFAHRLLKKEQAPDGLTGLRIRSFEFSKAEVNTTAPIGVSDRVLRERTCPGSILSRGCAKERNRGDELTNAVPILGERNQSDDQVVRKRAD